MTVKVNVNRVDAGLPLSFKRPDREKVQCPHAPHARHADDPKAGNDATPTE